MTDRGSGSIKERSAPQKTVACAVICLMKNRGICTILKCYYLLLWVGRLSRSACTTCIALDGLISGVKPAPG